MAASAKVTWVPAWAVRHDGSQIDEYRVSHREDVVTVRPLHTTATTRGGRWARRAYEGKFGATRREAIEKFRRMAERGVVIATDELQAAEALVARAGALATAEPQEPVQ